VKRKYDLAIPIGGSCSTSEAMRAAGLQFATLPLDWTGGPTFRAKVDLICADFARWMTKSGLHPLPATKFSRDIYMKDDVLGFTFNHDFSYGVPFDEDYERVKAKFDRRIRRLYELIGKSKRILIVSIGVPTSKDIPDEDLVHAREAFGRKWPGKTFEILYAEHREGRSFENRTEREADGIRCLTFDFQKREEGNAEWIADVKFLAKWLASEYEVRDYRTPEERRAWKQRQRKTRYGRYHADNLFDFIRTKIEYKLFRHLGKQLDRKGLV